MEAVVAGKKAKRGGWDGRGASDADAEALVRVRRVP